MIITLVLIAAVLTLLIAASLPLFGWGSGIDAAGRGMAMFFPVILMTGRIACLAGAVIALASDGGLAWTGLSGFWAGSIALVLLALLGLSSFMAVSLLVEHAPPSGSAGPAWIAAVFTPLLIGVWLLAEPYVQGTQIWAVRGLTAVFAVSSFVAALVALRHQARFAAAAVAQRQADEKALNDRLAHLPAGADLRATLAFLEALPEDDWEARDRIRSRATMMPDRVEQTMAMLEDPDRSVRLRGGRFAMLISMPQNEAYFAIAEREIAEVISRLERKAAGDAELAMEGRTAIALAWPAMHTAHLKKAQMAALYEALHAQGDNSACAALTHDAAMLKDYVTG